MFKFTLRKQQAQVNLHLNPETEFTNDETINISKFPLLYATPERQLNKSPCTALRSVKSTFDITYTQERSPIEPMNSTSMHTIRSDRDQSYLEQQSGVKIAFINHLCDSPLSSTALHNTTYSHYDSFTSIDESEQFHSVNGSFFDVNNKQEDNRDMFYVCHQSFQAKNAGQISLNYSDIVKAIYEKGEFCLVHHQSSGKRGYVPKSIINKTTQAWINNASLVL